MPRRIWVHKAYVAADTQAIVANKVKSVQVYFLDHYFDSLPVKKHHATFELACSASGILQTRIKFMDSSSYYFSHAVKFPMVKRSKKKITELRFQIPGDDRNFKMVHQLDKGGRVSSSDFSYLSERYEDCYSLMQKIEYGYNEKGLVNSAKYTNDGVRENKNFCYLEIFFEYDY